MWKLRFAEGAWEQVQELPVRERNAMVSALRKLEEIGPSLGSPHSSAVLGVDVQMRELRPRQGHSPWRAFYFRVPDGFLISSIGPEAAQNKRGFERAVTQAIERYRAEELES